MNARTSSDNKFGKDDFMAFSVPLAEERLDLYSLRSDADFALEWVHALLNKGALKVTVEARSVNEKALRHLFFESRNRERLGGGKSLAFGFPIVALQNEDGILAGPLLYWPLHMDPSPNTAESWVFSQEPEQAVLYNPVLVGALEEKFGIHLRDRLDAVMLHRRPAGSEVAAWVIELAGETGLHLDVDNLTARPCPDIESMGNLPENGSIFWSGILGLLPEYRQTAGESPLPPLEELAPQGHPFGLLDLDPWQATVLEHVRRSRLTAAAGISGSGKTHLIVDLIINALSNGKKCLVLSSRLPVLKEAQALVSRQGITAQHALIRDPHADQPALLGLLRSAMAAGTGAEAFPADRFKLLTEKAIRLKNKLDAGHTATRSPVFGAYNWTETVGIFLRSQRQAGKELLGRQLVTQDFAFTFEEYNTLRQGIAICQTLYPRINTLKHPLSVLKGELFIHKEKAAGLAYIRQQLVAFSERAARLHHRYISTLNGYSDKLNDLYQANYAKLHEGVFRAKGVITDLGNQYGADFEQNAESSLRLTRVLSSRSRNILAGREQVRAAYAELERVFAGRPVFDFMWLVEKDRKSIPKIKNNLLELEAALAQWNEQLPAQVQEEVQRLGGKTVHRDLPYTTIVTELEQGLDTLLYDLNESGLFEQPFVHQALTLPKRLKFLEEVMESFDNIRLYLKDYDDFYEWQRHWLQLPENGRKLVRALVKVKPQDWPAALDSWYFNNCLAMRFTPEMPGAEEDIAELAETLAALQPLILAGIPALWEERRFEAAKEIRRSGRKTALALSGGADEGLSLASIFKETGRSITDIFPVIFSVPAAARELFDVGTGFDYVIVDEAQAIPAVEAATLLHIGGRALVLGDPSQQLEKDDTSLLGLCEAAGCKVLPLNFIHRLKPGNLMQSVFPVTIADEMPRNFEMSVAQVHGFFREEDGVNEKEAEAALQLLNRVQPTPQRTLPAVGIVCATRRQRDLISYYLLRIKQKNEPGADVIRQLERNGLGVFHLEEIQGQHFDEIIFSATYGPTGPRAQVTRQIEQLETPQGATQLAALMSRAAIKVHVLSSIDGHMLDSLASNPLRRSSCLLANFMRFVAAFQQSNEREQRHIIERVTEMFSRGVAPKEGSVFHTEVADALTAYIGKERLAAGEVFGPVVLPLVVRDTDNRNVVAAVRADNSFLDTAFTDWRWEYRLRKRLRDKNVAFMPVWSAAWWRDAKEEARKLAGAILKI